MFEVSEESLKQAFGSIWGRFLEFEISFHYYVLMVSISYCSLPPHVWHLVLVLCSYVIHLVCRTCSVSLHVFLPTCSFSINTV